MLWPPTLVHVIAATLGLLSGFLAMALRKGSGLHGAAGTLFYVSMIVMTSTAAFMAAVLRPNMLNVVVSLLTLYLVVTGRRTAKNGSGRTGAFDRGAVLFAFAVGVAGITFGFEAAGSPTGAKDGMPAAIYFVFGTLALLHGVSDIRMIVRGGATGARRLVRHLWRMSFALLIATMSLYPGQARLFPKWLRETNLLLVPLLLLAGSIVYFLVRYRIRSRAAKGDVTGVARGESHAVRRVAA